MKHVRKIVLFSLLLIATAAAAQEMVLQGDSLGAIDSSKYLFHKVVKGETAYGITRMYNMTLEEFYEINPTAIRGIRLGEELLIPVSVAPAKEAVPAVRKDVASDDVLYIYHRVRKGETWYGIARLYRIELAALRAANPEYDDNLQEGTSLKIPYDQETLATVRERQEKETQDNTVHVVAEGETLWSISQALGVTVDELRKSNPALSTAIKVGDRIKIPQKEQPASGDVAPAEKAPVHVVKQGETLYSIARFYGVAVDSLLLHNPQVSGTHIAFGDTLSIPFYRNVYGFIEYKTEKRESMVEIANRFRIPVGELGEKNPGYKNNVPKGRVVLVPVQEGVAEVMDSIITQEQVQAQPAIEDTVCIGGWEKERTYTVALMLPFAGQQFRKGMPVGSGRGSKAADYPFFRYIQFYQGALLALESLSAEGINVRLNVYDMGARAEEVDKILAQPEMQEVDLMIGIIFAKPFSKVSDFAAQHGIPLINVTSSREDILAGCPHVAKIVPSEAYIPEAIMDILPDPLRMNLILVRSSETDFQADADIFKINYPYAKEFIIGDNANGIVSMLDPARENYILVMSDHKVKVMDLMRVLDEKRKKYKINMIGYPRWDKVPDLSYRYAQNLKLHFVVPQLIDYEDDSVNAFIYNFRARYNSEPYMLAFQGYDMLNYFVRSAALFGKKCLPCAGHVPYRFISTQGLRLESAPGNGYENIFWNIYTIKDYKTVVSRE